jgi:hypothetical protein
LSSNAIFPGAGSSNDFLVPILRVGTPLSARLPSQAWRSADCRTLHFRTGFTRFTRCLPTPKSGSSCPLPRKPIVLRQGERPPYNLPSSPPKQTPCRATAPVAGPIAFLTFSLPLPHHGRRSARPTIPPGRRCACPPIPPTGATPAHQFSVFGTNPVSGDRSGCLPPKNLTPCLPWCLRVLVVNSHHGYSAPRGIMPSSARMAVVVFQH